MRNISKMQRFYNGFALMVFNIGLLFIFANVAAWLYMITFPDHSPNSKYYLRNLWQESTRYFTTPRQEWEKDRAFLRHIYPDRSDAEIAALMNTPSMRAHPTLEYMETPIRSKFYNVGIENMRYHQYVHDGNAADMIDDATWVFGGSTGFGDGVADDETIAAHLNALDSSSVYINFSVQGYNQNSEIEKLLLLLKKGYRPRRVLFIDGLNDITLMRATNFHPAETPARNFNAYGYVANVARLQRPDTELILRRLPLFELIYSWRDRQQAGKLATVSVKNGYADIYQPENLYHRDPLLHYHLLSVWESEFDSVFANIGHYQEKIIHYYSLNNAYLDKLAAAFGFDYYIFFQPLGYAQLKNPFITDPAAYEKTLQYRSYLTMKKTVQSAIAAKRFRNFYDVANVDSGCGDCYVDLLHYNPRLSRMIAVEMFKVLH